MATTATGVLHLASALASFDTWPDTKRKAPIRPNLIVPRRAALSEYVSIERQLRLFAERQPGVVGEGDFQPRRLSGCDDLVAKHRGVQPKGASGAAPRPAGLAWMRLTAPMASCAADHPAAKPQTSITATKISRCNMRRSPAGVIIAARTCSGTCSSARPA